VRATSDGWEGRGGAQAEVAANVSTSHLVDHYSFPPQWPRPLHPMAQPRSVGPAATDAPPAAGRSPYPPPSVEELRALLGLDDMPPARWGWATSDDYAAEGDALGDPAAPDMGVSGVKYQGVIGNRARLPALMPMPHMRWRERDCRVQLCSALTGAGVADGLDWLVGSFKNTLG
jgi:hypothetical protein